MKRNIFLLVLLISSVLELFAQESEKKQALSINWGIGSIQRQDLVFSPFIHTDLSLMNIGLEYKRETNKYQKLSLSYSGFNPMLMEPYEFMEHGEVNTAYPHSFTFIDIDYQLGKTLMNNDKQKLTAGGVIGADIQATSYAYGRLGFLGYYAATGLGIFTDYTYKLNSRSGIQASIQLPVLSWLARSPYLVNDDEFIENISSHSGVKTFFSFIGDGKLATWNTLQYANAGLNFYYKISNKWDLGTKYKFEFIHADEPRNLLSFRNSYSISGTYKF